MTFDPHPVHAVRPVVMQDGRLVLAVHHSDMDLKRRYLMAAPGGIERMAATVSKRLSSGRTEVNIHQRVFLPFDVTIPDDHPVLVGRRKGIVEAVNLWWQAEGNALLARDLPRELRTFLWFSVEMPPQLTAVLIEQVSLPIIFYDASGLDFVAHSRLLEPGELANAAQAQASLAAARTTSIDAYTARIVADGIADILLSRLLELANAMRSRS